MFIDLDHFKPVNDTHGHAAGDAVLVDAARRMQSVLRGSDTVGRLAGDEFVIIAPALTTAHARAIAEKVSTLLQQPFKAGEATVRISGSIGIAMFPDAGEDYPMLLRAADAAMYRAKAHRRASYSFA
jgi:diguanylate cyclase (GGDEF)-like protein